MVEVVQAQEHHIPDIVEVWKEFMDFHGELDPLYTRREDGHVNWERFLDSLIAFEGAFVLVVLDGEKVIAYSITQIKDYPPVFVKKKYGFISDMAVTSTHRRTGIGELMLTGIFDWLESRGIKRVELRVAPNNRMGYSFWKKHGFRDHVQVMCLDR